MRIAFRQQRGSPRVGLGMFALLSSNLALAGLGDIHVWQKLRDSSSHAT